MVLSSSPPPGDDNGPSGAIAGDRTALSTGLRVAPFALRGTPATWSGPASAFAAESDSGSMDAAHVASIRAAEAAAKRAAIADKLKVRDLVGVS